MKKLLAALTALMLCVVPILADYGSADVKMEGEVYHLTLTGVEIADGHLNVSVTGFGDTLRMDAGGWMMAGWAEARYAGEDTLVRADNVTGTVGGTFTFIFERNDLPAEIWMDPYDEGEEEVLIWSDGGNAPAEAAASSDAAEPASDSSEENSASGILPGDQLLFGHYDQDDNTGNGAEPIAWIVLDAEDGLATLMSRDVLDARAFNGLGTSITWEGCSLRKWLNGDFLDKAFDDAERAALQTVTVTADGNPEFPDADPGADTEDTVYLLSIAEAQQYFGALHILPPMPTGTAIANGVYESNISGEEGQSLFWLRTPGAYSDSAAYIISNNDLMASGNDVSNTDYGVRPVVKADLAALATLSGPVEKTEPEYPEELEETFAEEIRSLEGDAEAFAALSAGDNILFGHYNQDNDPDNGAESIEWIVLDVQDGTATLMSRFVLDARAFNGLGMSITWEKCSLRQWLNGDFLREAFTDEERAALQTVIVKADRNPDNPDADTGKDTQDAVYLLSISEASDYFGALNIAPALPTRTAIANGIYVSNTSGYVGETAWWLRTPGGYQDRAAYIVSDNQLQSHGGEVGKTNYGIRPIIKVNLSDLYGVASLVTDVAAPVGAAAELTPKPTPEPTPAVTPTPEPAPEPAATPAVTPAPEPASEPAEAPTETPAEASESNASGIPEEPAGEDEMLAALDNDVYRTTYDALLAGEVIQNGSKGDTANGVQQTLVSFGQDIAVDGSVGPRTIAALNAVQAAFGLAQTESLDATGYAELLPPLLISTNPDEADVLLQDQMDPGEYEYMRACALVAQGKYYSAKAVFEGSGWEDWEDRAAACILPWPETGVLYRNPDVQGSSTELTVKFNTDPDTAMLVKIYTADDVLARTMFIGGTGQATCSLPAGTYTIKDGTGKTWYGEEEAFGDEGSYEIMTFEGGQQEVRLEQNYSSTITVNVQEDNPDAKGVGSDWESWDDF